MLCTISTPVLLAAWRQLAYPPVSHKLKFDPHCCRTLLRNRPEVVAGRNLFSSFKKNPIIFIYLLCLKIISLISDGRITLYYSAFAL